MCMRNSAGIKHLAEPLDIVAQRVSARARVICLDEFFVADIADAMILAGLVRGPVPPRRDAGRDLQSAAAKISTRMACSGSAFCPPSHLIQAHVDVVHLDGGIDYRLRQLERAPTYLDSKLPETPPLLKGDSSALAGGQRGPATLPIEAGRCAPSTAGPASVLVRVQRTVRRTAQPERLHRTRAPLSHDIHRQHSGIHALRRQRGAPLHHADRRILRSQRQDRGDRRRRRRPACIAASGCASNSSAQPAGLSRCRRSHYLAGQHRAVKPPHAGIIRSMRTVAEFKIQYGRYSIPRGESWRRCRRSPRPRRGGENVSKR